MLVALRGLAVAAILLSMWQIEAAPQVWAWAHGSWLLDPMIAARRQARAG